MKDVYVLYGRIYLEEGVYDHDGNLFSEAPILEIFDNYEIAYKQFEKYVVDAYNELKDSTLWFGLDETFVEETTEADLFSNYNFYTGVEGMSVEEFMTEYNKFTDALPDMSISWFFKKIDGDCAEWVTEFAKFSNTEELPILPRLYIEKKEIQL